MGVLSKFENWSVIVTSQGKSNSTVSCGGGGFMEVHSNEITKHSSRMDVHES